MKKYLLLASITLLFAGTSLGSTERVTSKVNEYGGQTIETIYSKGDNQFAKLLRDITSLDKNGNIVKVEYFYTSKAVDTTGVSRAIIHVLSNSKISKQENYYVDNTANNLGFEKMIQHYNDNEKLEKLESYYTAKSAQIRGFYKAILYVQIAGSRIEYLCTPGFSLESGVDKFVAFLDKDKKLTRLDYFKDGQKLLLSADKVSLIRSRITTNIKELNF